MSSRKTMKSNYDEEIAEILSTIPPDKVYTQMKNIDKGVLISFSNLGGCPKENYKGDDITQTPCKNSTYQAIARFLRKNPNNRVVFMGNIFGNGPYAMTDIHNMIILFQEFNYSNGQPKTLEGENQVEVILGEKDINILQLKYGLHKFLLKQDVSHPEIGIEMPSVIKFTDKASRKQGKAFGNYIPYNHMIRKDFSHIHTQVLVNSIYQRVTHILQTCGCHMPYCLLFDVNFSDFYQLAKNEQNIELMLLIEQLSVFTLTYAFVPDGIFEKHISSVEVFNIVEFLLGQINSIINELRTHRTDIYVRQMGEIYQRMETLIADPKNTDTFIEELMPLKNWKNTILHFYNNSKLIHYDRTYKSLFVQFDPTYSLPLFIHCFTPFAEYVREDKAKRYTHKPVKGELWSLEKYYENFSNIYEDFLCQKLVYNICNPKNHPYQEYVDLKRNNRKNSKNNSSPVNTNTFFNNEGESSVKNEERGAMDGGSTSKLTQKKLRRDFKIKKIKSSKNTKKSFRHWSSINKKQTGGDNKSLEDDLSANTYFDGVQSDETRDLTSRLYKFKIDKSNYLDLKFIELILNINRYWRGILKYPAKLQSDTELNQFIFLQVFYLFLRKNKGRISPLNGKHIRKNKELYELFRLKKIYNIFIANIDFNMHFSLPLINIYGVTFIFLDKLIEVKKKFDTPRKGKFLHDSYEDYQAKEILKLYNYPLMAINTTGMLENTSLTITGNLKIKKTYLGPYYFHTFNNFFLLHEALTDVNLKEYKADFAINPEGDYLKLESYMLPPLITDNIGEDPKTFLIDNIYFIKLMPDVEALNEFFLILDLEKCVKGGRIGYYLGKITQWMGFFWNTKNMYHRKMTNIEQIREGFDNYIENYLPAITTDRLFMPFTKPLDITLRDEPSILYKKYKFDSRLSRDDFILPKETSRNDDKPKIQFEENSRLNKLKNMFDTMFGSNNLRKPLFTLEYKNLESSDDFETGIDTTVDKKKIRVTIPVNNVEALLEKKSLAKGSFKEIFGYNKKTQDTKKFRFVVAKENSEHLTDSYFQELSVLLFLSFPDKIYTKYANRINPCVGLNIYDSNFYYLTPKSELGGLESIILNKGKIRDNNYFFEDSKIHNKRFYDLMLNLVEGLIFIHHKKILHLDFFSRNIMCYLEGNTIIFKIIDFGFSELNKGNLMLEGSDKKTKVKVSLTTQSVEDSLDGSRMDAEKHRVKVLRDLTSPDTKKKDVICNHIVKRIPNFSCPLGRSYTYKLMGNQTDIWNLGYIFLNILGAHQNFNQNEDCFLQIKTNSPLHEQIKNIMELINLYHPEDKDEEGKVYLDVLYNLLINKIENNNFQEKPVLENNDITLFATPNLSDIQEKASQIKGKALSIPATVIRRSRNKLVFKTNKKLYYSLLPEACKFLHMCYTAYSSRLELTEILKQMEGSFKDFANMGEIIVKKELNLSAPDNITPTSSTPQNRILRQKLEIGKSTNHIIPTINEIQPYATAKNQNIQITDLGTVNSSQSGIFKIEDTEKILVSSENLMKDPANYSSGSSQSSSINSSTVSVNEVEAAEILKPINPNDTSMPKVSNTNPTLEYKYPQTLQGIQNTMEIENLLDFFEIVPATGDGNCGYHVILTSLVYNYMHILQNLKDNTIKELRNALEKYNQAINFSKSNEIQLLGAAAIEKFKEIKIYYNIFYFMNYMENIVGQIQDPNPEYPPTGLITEVIIRMLGHSPNSFNKVFTHRFFVNQLRKLLVSKNMRIINYDKPTWSDTVKKRFIDENSELYKNINDGIKIDNVIDSKYYYDQDVNMIFKDFFNINFMLINIQAKVPEDRLRVNPVNYRNNIDDCFKNQEPVVCMLYSGLHYELLIPKGKNSPGTGNKTTESSYREKIHDLFIRYNSKEMVQTEKNLEKLMKIEIEDDDTKTLTSLKQVQII